MSATYLTRTGPELSFASELYVFLESLDPSVWREEALQATRDGLERLRAYASDLTTSYRGARPVSDVEGRVQEAVRTLHGAMPRAEAVAGPDDVLDLKDRLTPLYEAMAAALNHRGEPVNHLRPTNWARSLFHLASGLTVAGLTELVFSHTLAMGVALAFVLLAWTLEGTRRVFPRWNDVLMRVFAPITRDHERYRVNAATWYGTALLLLTLTAFGPAGVTGVLALAVGDPAAGTIGRRYGRTRLGGGKSLEGALAFVVATVATVAVYLGVFHPGLGAVAIGAMALVAGIVGAATELWSVRIQDNFSIPVLTAWAVLAVQWMVSV